MLAGLLAIDSGNNLQNTAAIYTSKDKGQSFQYQFDIWSFYASAGEPRLSLPDGRILGWPSTLQLKEPGRYDTFLQPRFEFSDGGASYNFTAKSAEISLPFELSPSVPASRQTKVHGVWLSPVIAMPNGEWISTMNGLRPGQTKWECWAIASQDGGHTWKWVGTVAAADLDPTAPEGFDEPGLELLDDGSLVCVSRMGNFTPMALTRSYDNARTWTPVQRLPVEMGSVAPQLCRMSNGILALSAGRPGITLSLSLDGRGTKWEAPINVSALYAPNTVRSDTGIVSVNKLLEVGRPYPTLSKATLATPSTCYTALIESEPGCLMMSYDLANAGIVNTLSFWFR
jgi:BNR repeat-like domain